LAVLVSDPLEVAASIEPVSDPLGTEEGDIDTVTAIGTAIMTTIGPTLRLGLVRSRWPRHCRITLARMLTHITRTVIRISILEAPTVTISRSCRVME
jgi:hypothetical protein